MSNSRTLSDFIGSSGTPAFASNTTFSANVAVTGAAALANTLSVTGNATFSNTATFSSPVTLSVNNSFSGYSRGSSGSLSTALFIDSTSTGDRSVLALRAGANNSVPFSIVEAGLLLNDPAPYSVLNLTRTNHANASPVQTGIFFESKNSTGTIAEWGGITAGRTVTDGSDNRGSLYLYSNGRTLAASFDYAGRMRVPNQPVCVIACQGADLNWNSGGIINFGGNTTYQSTTLVDNYNSFNYSNGRYTAPIAGNYLITATANGRYYNGGVPRARIRKNGASIGNDIHIRGNSTINGSGGDLDQRTMSLVVPLAAGDYIDFYVYENGFDTFGSNYFCAYMLG